MSTSVLVYKATRRLALAFNAAASGAIAAARWTLHAPANAFNWATGATALKKRGLNRGRNNYGRLGLATGFATGYAALAAMMALAVPSSLGAIGVCAAFGVAAGFGAQRLNAAYIVGKDEVRQRKADLANLRWEMKQEQKEVSELIKRKRRQLQRQADLRRGLEL